MPQSRFISAISRTRLRAEIAWGTGERRAMMLGGAPKSRSLTARAAAFAALALLGLAACWNPPALADTVRQAAPVYTMSPVGWIRKSAGRTYIVIDERYQPALLGVADLKSIWVLYWFDRNDSPDKRSTLQVHPRGDPDRPLRGVFATRSPFRPNLIAQSSVNVIAVRGNVMEIDDIDAFADTPVLDLKP